MLGCNDKNWLSARHGALDEIVDVAEVAFLSHSVVMVPVGQLLPDACLRFADFEKLLHVCRAENGQYGTNGAG